MRVAFFVVKRIACDLCVIINFFAKDNMMQNLIAEALILILISKKPEAKKVKSVNIVAQAVPKPVPGGESKCQFQLIEDKEEENDLLINSYPVISNTSVRQAVLDRPAPENVQGMIDQYAGQYGVDAQKMKNIASCESGFRPEALSDNGLYGGMYQFVASTWVSNRKAMGADPNPSLRYSAEEAIKTAAFKMGRDGYGAWPVCSQI